MKKISPILFAFFILIGFTACMKDQEVYDPQEHLDLEAPIIASYVDKDSTLKDIAQKHESSGIWYVVENEGTGSYDYELWPDITVKYSGKLLNGMEFDSSDSLTFNLKNTITAWVYAFIPQEVDGKELGGITMYGLQKGAKIRIVTPSPWGYGSAPKDKIPADSPLDFTIEVIDIQAPLQQ